MRYAVLACRTCRADSGPLSTHASRLRHLLVLEAAGKIPHATSSGILFARDHPDHDLEVEEAETAEWIRRGRLEVKWV